MLATITRLVHRRFGRLISFDPSAGCGIILGADGVEVAVTAAVLAKAGIAVAPGDQIEYQVLSARDGRRAACALHVDDCGREQQ